MKAVTLQNMVTRVTQKGHFKIALITTDKLSQTKTL